MGDSGEDGIRRGEGGLELSGDVDIARRGGNEIAGEKGGGDEGGNGLEGVKTSSTSMLLSLSLVRGGNGSIDPSAGEVGRDDSVAGDGAEITSGTIDSLLLSSSADREGTTDAGMDGAGSEMGLEAITTSATESFAGADLRVESKEC